MICSSASWLRGSKWRIVGAEDGFLRTSQRQEIKPCSYQREALFPLMSSIWNSRLKRPTKGPILLLSKSSEASERSLQLESSWSKSICHRWQLSILASTTASLKLTLQSLSGSLKIWPTDTFSGTLKLAKTSQGITTWEIRAESARWEIFTWIGVWWNSLSLTSAIIVR